MGEKPEKYEAEKPNKYEAEKPDKYELDELNSYEEADAEAEPEADSESFEDDDEDAEPEMSEIPNFVPDKYGKRPPKNIGDHIKVDSGDDYLDDVLRSPKELKEKLRNMR